jgi:hypothetical protein
MLWRVHPETVNLVPLGKQSWFDSKLLHQFLARSYRGYYVGLSIRSREFESPTSRQFCGKESKRRMGKSLARQ